MPTNEFLEERIAIRIAKATDALQKSFELTPRLVSAAEQLSNCILNDGKILVIGTGSSAAIGQILRLISCIVSNVTAPDSQPSL
mgnify:CR=1 FL=1